MITIDLFYHLAVIGIYLFFWIVGFIIFYHLTRFGIGVHPKRLAAIYFIGSICLFLLSFITFSSVDINQITALI